MSNVYDTLPVDAPASTGNVYDTIPPDANVYDHLSTAPPASPEILSSFKRGIGLENSRKVALAQPMAEAQPNGDVIQRNQFNDANRNSDELLNLPAELGQGVETVGAALLNYPVRAYRNTFGTPKVPVSGVDANGNPTLGMEDKPLPFQPGVPLLKKDIFASRGENDALNNLLNNLTKGATTPGNILTLPAAEANLVKAYFLTQTVPAAINGAKTALDPTKTREERIRGGLDGGVNSLFSFLLSKGAFKGEPTPEFQGPPSTGETLNTPRGATPPPLDELHDVSTIPSAGPTFSGIKESDIPKAPKAEVPATEPEAEKSINVSEEIRNNAAKTVADIQRLFPNANLSREQARALRNTAYPNAVFGVNEAGTDLLSNKGAGQPQTVQPPEQRPVPPIMASSDEVKPQEPPSQPTIPNPNTTPLVTQVAELPIEEAQSQPVEETKPAEGGSVGETKTPPAVPAPEAAPEVKPEAPDTTGDTPYGIAERVRTEREKAGTGPETKPGEVPNAEESVANGRKMIQEGVDPESALKNFEATGQSKATDIALVRAQGEKLAKAASDAADSKGIDSLEYQAAKNASFDWDKRTKKLQTDWAERGQAQQGHTDLDTGNFHELARAHHEATGKEFTPDQAKTAQKLSKGVKAATTAEEVAKKRVLDAIKEPESTPAQKSVADKISQALEKAASEAYARIRKRAAEGKVFAGLDPVDLADHALFGAAKIAKGAVDFTKWSAEMVKDLGEYVKPHLKQIWDAAHEEYNKRIGANAGTKKELSTQQQVWKRAKELLNEGENDFDDIRHKIATEMGLPVKDVTKLLSENQGVKRMSDEMYRRMSDSRRLKQQAQSWLKNQQTPGWIKFTKEVPRAFFAAKVFGHGTVGMITHAGLNVFNPLAWKTYWPEFFRQFPMAVKTPFHDAKAFHERMMQDLIRDPNYVTARRAGLANDPFKYSDDYQNATMKSFIEKLDKANPISGSRGFDALKTFRQARFNQIWNALPESQKTPNVAKVVADAVNHSSGVVKTTLPEWMQTAANVSLFAPKLEMSRWAWLVQDPAKAAITFTNWKKASPAARVQAMIQLKEKATVAAVYASLLAANQGMLKAFGSSQNVNTTDPTKSDFMSFKVADHKVGVVGPMIGMVRMFAELAHAAIGKRTPAEKRDSRYSEAVGDIGKYARGKASPFASVAIDAAAQADFRGQPLPFSNDKVPTYLRKEGLGKYTWPKYATDKLAPIPVEEAIREVWTDMGLQESQQKTYLNAIIAGFAAGSSGIRYSKDFQNPSTGNR